MTDRDIVERLRAMRGPWFGDGFPLLNAYDLADTIEALRAEVAEVREELQSVLASWNAIVAAIGSPTHGGAVGHARALRERAERAEAERDALRADAERLDSGVIALETWSAFEGERVTCVHSGVNLRAAIDAARAREADPIAAFMAQQAEASRPLRPGEPCPDCDGTGAAGGQFTGGYWPCERCGATGAGTQEADRG